MLIHRIFMLRVNPEVCSCKLICKECSSSNIKTTSVPRVCKNASEGYVSVDVNSISTSSSGESLVIEVGILSPRPTPAPHPLCTNGWLNGHPANVWVDFCHLQSVRANIRHWMYWFSKIGEIGCEFESSTSEHKSRVQRTFRNRPCRSDSGHYGWLEQILERVDKNTTWTINIFTAAHIMPNSKWQY